MSKLRKPVGFFAEQDNTPIDNNQKTVITAKHLDAQSTESSDVQSISHLVAQDSLPQSVQESGILGDQEASGLEGQEAKHQNVQEPKSLNDNTPERLGSKASKRQNAEKLDGKETEILDAVPPVVQTPGQQEVKPQDAEASDQLGSQTVKTPGDEATKPLDGETPKKKKAKSASLIKKTYYIDPDLDGAIELMAVLQKGDQSDIIRQLLRSAIPEYYLTQWKAMRDHSK